MCDFGINCIITLLRPPVSDEIAYGPLQQGIRCVDIDRGHVPVTAQLNHCDTDSSTQVTV